MYKRQPQPRERTFAVNVVTAEPKSITPQLEAFGEIKSRRTLDLRLAIGGQVTELSKNFVDGGQVKLGEKLVELNDADAQSSYLKAKADIMDAQAEVEDAGRALSLSQDELEAAVAKQFKGKATAIELNITALGLGRDYFKDNFTKEDPYVVEAREIETPKFFIDGNEAAALGSIFGGVQMLAWYPITPSSSLAEGIINYIPQLRVDDEGNATCAVIQAEDELAAAGMVVGAGWAGGRGMSCTSGPGISLMSEFIGLFYFAEVPGVIWDVNRTGPSTGLPTRTQQGDLSMLYEASHGDTQHIVLIPGTVEELSLIHI